MTSVVMNAETDDLSIWFGLQKMKVNLYLRNN